MTAAHRAAGLVVGLLLSAVALAACSGGSAPAPTTLPSLTFEYAPGLSEDVYLPAGRASGPLVVLVPGGSWTTADPAGLAPLAAGLAEAGVAAAPTQIRAAEDGVVYPVPVEDILCAVAAAVEHVKAGGFVPDRVAVLGHSSGAHLAALAVLAYADHTPACSSPLVEPDALVGLSGPYDISRIPDIAKPLLGTDPADDPESWASANPVRRADLRPDVPVLLMHGEADTTVPLAFTTQFADALKAAGHATTVTTVPGVDHLGIFQPDVATDPIATWLLRLG